MLLRNHWAISTLTGGGILVTFILRNNIAPVASLLKSQLHINDFQLGLALSSFLWIYTLLQPVAGWATDNYGARATLLVGVLAASIITIITGSVTTLAALVSLRIALGVAQAPNFVTGAKVSSSNWVKEDHRARATSVWIAGGRLGTAIALPFAALLAVYFGWQWAFYGTGLLGLAWCALWYAGFKNNPLDIPNSKRKNADGTGLRQNLPILLSPLGLGLAIASFGQGYLAYYLNTWVPDYLVREQKFTILNAGVFSALPILSAVVTIILIGGFLSDYRVKKGASHVRFRGKLFSLGMIISSVMLFVTAFSRNIAAATSIQLISSPYFTVASLSLAGAAWGVATPSLWVALVEATPKHVTGLMGGIQNLGGNLGGIVVLIFTGYVLQITGQYFLALLTVGGFTLLAAASALFLVKPEVEPIVSR